MASTFSKGRESLLVKETPSRRDRLLGLSSGSSIVGGLAAALAESEDPEELTEQDLWDEEARRYTEDEQARNDSLWFVRSRSDMSEARKTLINGNRRWFPLDKDQNDAIFSRGLSSLSPLNRTPVNPVPTGRDASAIRIQTPSRLIHQVGARSADGGRHMMMQQSAPVNIVDWSKMTGSTRKMPDLGAEEEEEEDGEDERLPPHELLAREYAKSQRTAASVFEGVGRTLKGRDLSRVRNAVLRQTGFLDT